MMFPSIFNKLHSIWIKKILLMKVNVGIKNILTKKLYFAKFKHRKTIIKNHLHSAWHNFNI